MALSQNEKEQFYNAFGSSYQPSTTEHLQLYLDRVHNGRECSWLAPENYDHIRNMVLHDDIAVATMDLRDSKRIDALSEWLDRQNLRIGDAYISSAMDFADPHLKTDYYSKSMTIEQARAFFDNLLSIGDDHTAFVVSHALGTVPILQSYHLDHIQKDEIRKIRDGLPQQEPPWQERTYSILINAGGRVWRIQSFDGQSYDNMKLNTGRYLRIFSEVPSSDKAGIQSQLDVINRVLESLPGVSTHPVTDIEKAADTRYFDYQAGEATHPYFQLSSRVFQLAPDAGDATIDSLIDRIKTALDGPKKMVS
jgi:hypothetical protein